MFAPTAIVYFKWLGTRVPIAAISRLSKDIRLDVPNALVDADFERDE